MLAASRDMTNDSAKPIKQDDFDRPKPISDARLSALEELSALDQELELKYGIVGNPMIKAQERTPATLPPPNGYAPRGSGSTPVGGAGCAIGSGERHE